MQAPDISPGSCPVSPAFVGPESQAFPVRGETYLPGQALPLRFARGPLPLEPRAASLSATSPLYAPVTTPYNVTATSCKSPSTSPATSCKSPSTAKGILCSLAGNSVEGVSFKPTPSTIECPGTPPEPSSRGRRFAGSRQRPPRGEPFRRAPRSGAA